MSDTVDIMAEWNIDKLKQLAGLSPHLFQSTSQALRNRAHEILNPYIQDVYPFLECLREEFGLISGSAALAMAMPRFKEFVGDIDIYVGKDNKKMLRHLKLKEGECMFYVKIMASLNTPSF